MITLIVQEGTKTQEYQFPDHNPDNENITNQAMFLELDDLNLFNHITDFDSSNQYFIVTKQSYSTDNEEISNRTTCFARLGDPRDSSLHLYNLFKDENEDANNCVDGPIYFRFIDKKSIQFLYTKKTTVEGISTYTNKTIDLNVKTLDIKDRGKVRDKSYIEAYSWLLFGSASLSSSYNVYCTIDIGDGNYMVLTNDTIAEHDYKQLGLRTYDGTTTLKNLIMDDESPIFMTFNVDYATFIEFRDDAIHQISSLLEQLRATSSFFITR